MIDSEDGTGAIEAAVGIGATGTEDEEAEVEVLVVDSVEALAVIGTITTIAMSLGNVLINPTTAQSSLHVQIETDEAPVTEAAAAEASREAAEAIVAKNAIETIERKSVNESEIEVVAEKDVDLGIDGKAAL